MQFTAAEQITVLLTRARARERMVLGQIAKAPAGDKQHRAALLKRLQERQARIAQLKAALRYAKEEANG